MSDFKIPSDMTSDNRMPAAFQRADQIIAGLKLGNGHFRATDAQRVRLAYSQFFEPHAGSPSRGRVEMAEDGAMMLLGVVDGVAGNAEIGRDGNTIREW